MTEIEREQPSEAELTLDELESMSNVLVQPNKLQKTTNWLREHWRGAAFTGALTLGAIGAAGYASTHEIDYSSLAKQFDISKFGRDFIDIAEVGGPILLAAGAVELGVMSSSRPGRKNLKLAWTGLAENKYNSFQKVAAGALLPTLGIWAISNALMIEDGIHRGANPNIVTINDSLTTKYPESIVSWGTQKGTHHFMNDSHVSHNTVSKVNSALQSGQYPNVSGVQPYYRDLVTIPTPFSDNQAGMVFSVGGGSEPSPMLPEVKSGANCRVVMNKCNLGPDEMIIDENEGFKVGDEVEIRDHKYRVVAFPKEDQSLVNRLVAFTGVDEKQLKDNDYFGFVTVAKSAEDVKHMIQDLGVGDKIDQQSTQEFLDANDDFWYHNGTTLLFLLIGDITLFGSASFASMKRFEQERDRPTTATINAIGGTNRQLAQQAFARSIVLTGKGIVPGAAIAVISTELINKILVGFHGETDPKMVGASAGIILASQFGATAKSMRSMKKEPLAQRMKSK